MTNGAVRPAPEAPKGSGKCPTNASRDVASREKKTWVKYDLTALWASEVKIFTQTDRN